MKNSSIIQKYVLTVTLNPAIDSILLYKKKSKITKLEREVRVGAGKGINVSRALQSLGVNSLATGLIGGPHGLLIEKLLKVENIQSHFFSVSRNNRLNLSLVLPQWHTPTRIFHQSPSVSKYECERFMKLYDQLLDRASMVILSGRSVVGLSNDIYAQLIKLARNKQVLTFLDASDQSLKSGIMAKPDFIKPNLNEIKQLLGLAVKSRSHIRDVIIWFRKKGIKTIYISMGSEGAIGCNNKDLWYAKAPKIRSVNPVGCGDAFVAVVCAGYLRKENFIDNLKLAVAAGATTASSIIPGKIDYPRAQHYAQKIKIQKLRF